MSPADVAKVLAKASAFDQRTVGAADVAAWHEVLADVQLADALAAVTRHYADQTERLMPAHVRRLAREGERDRRRVERERREQLALTAEAADPTRRDRSDDVRALIERLRAELPEGDPDQLRYGHKEWRLARERRERAHRPADTNAEFAGFPTPAPGSSGEGAEQ